MGKLNLQIQMFKLSKVLVAALLLSSVEGRNLGELNGMVEVERAGKERGIDRSEEAKDRDPKSKVAIDYGDVVEAEEAKEATKKIKDGKKITKREDAEEANFEDELNEL